jgi:branched-subunit amino acid transport protein
MTVWITLLAAGAASYLFRFGPASLVDRVQSLGRLQRAATYVVAVVFTAVAADALVARMGAGPGSMLAPLGAVAVGLVAARRLGSSTAAIAAGMPTLWALTAGLPR